MKLSKKTISSLFAIFSTVLLFTNCKKDDNNPAPIAPATIIDVVSADTSFSILKAAVIKAGLTEALKANNLTVFAPTNAAFRKAKIDVNATDATTLGNILKYHVLGAVVKAASLAPSGNTKSATLQGDTLFVTASKLKINGSAANITKTDVTTTGGSVVHVIDAVLNPPAGDIATIATGKDYGATFSLLVYALGKAGLVSTFQNTGSYTVFAPTNAAFISFLGASSESDAKSKIDALSTSTLTTVLTYHVVAGRVFSSNLANGTAKTLQGGNVTINTTGPTVKGNSNTSASNVVVADVLAKNGVIHAIDAVLQP